jgi:RNA polymerase primary sigma factor
MEQSLANPVPDRLIETINKLVRTSQQMLIEIGRMPTEEELAKKLAMPLETVRKLLNIAKAPLKAF